MPETLNWRRFTQDDWIGFCGAQPFADHTDPLMCQDVRVDRAEAITVMDGTGCWVAWTIDDVEYLAHGPYYLTAMLPRETTRRTLEDLGFEVEEF